MLKRSKYFLGEKICSKKINLLLYHLIIKKKKDVNIFIDFWENNYITLINLLHG